MTGSRKAKAPIPPTRTKSRVALRWVILNQRAPSLVYLYGTWPEAGTECINKEYSIPHGMYLEIEGKWREHAWASYVFNIEEYIKLLPHF